MPAPFILRPESEYFSLRRNSSEDRRVPLADSGPLPYILIDPTANKERIMSQDNVPVWFITGCSTGFGREIAQQVLDRGWRAVVTARDPGQVRDIVAGREDAALVLGLDVNDKEAVTRERLKENCRVT
jgi:short chain dehydrogenase